MNLEGAIEQLRQERDRLDAAIRSLELIGGSTRTATRFTGRRSSARAGRRRLSPAAIAKMRASQRARRERERAGSQVAPKTNRRRRQISPEGLAKIRAGQRKRWARVRRKKK